MNYHSGYYVKVSGELHAPVDLSIRIFLVSIG
jgi:hypothetical protein